MTQADWLEPYVEFMALRELLDGTRRGRPGSRALRDRDPQRVARGARRGTASRLERCASSSGSSPSSGASCGVRRVAGACCSSATCRSSSRTTAPTCGPSRDLFQLDAHGRPTTVTGVPPDYFAADGQRWNNPHYDWDAMAADGFAWWRRRIARQRELFDLVRIDHFRGFEAAWHVPVGRADRPGRALGARARAATCSPRSSRPPGPGTLVAEDLGVITPEVERAARRSSGCPGMKVLQFAFDGDPDNPYLPAAPRRAERRLHRHARQRHHPGVVALARRGHPRPRCATKPGPTPTSRCPGRWSGSPWPRPRGWPSYRPRTCSASAARRG